MTRSLLVEERLAAAASGLRLDRPQTLPDIEKCDAPQRVGPSVGLVHEWLVSYAGSERVLEALAELWPDAPIHALVHDPRPFAATAIARRRVVVSPLARIPWSSRLYPLLLRLMPRAVEQHDLSDYDVVVSSHHAVAKGALTRSDQLHICYVHTPMRYAWDLQAQYLARGGLLRGIRNLYARRVLHAMRQWDVATASRPDLFVANSAYVARRIEKTWRRPALVLHPPVDVDAFPLPPPGRARGDFFITASRLVPYKRVDVIVDAFARRPDLRLVVLGDGPERARLAERAAANTTFLGHVPADVLREHFQRARAFVFAAEEDFGIVPVEAMACGVPVLAFGRGGACETVVSGVTGLWFARQDAASLGALLDEFLRLESTFDPLRIRRHAERFSRGRFQARFRQLVAASWRAFTERGPLAPERERDELLPADGL